MRRYSIVIALGLWCSSLAHAGPAEGIIGGALDGDRHSNVGLLIGYDDEGPWYGCSGTLVHPRVFLTAAHCTGGQPSLVPTDVRITFESAVPLDGDGLPAPTLYVTGTPIPNPAFTDPEDDLIYTIEQISNDIGVVILDVPAEQVFPGVTPAELPPAAMIDELKSKVGFEIVGYGLFGQVKPLKPEYGFDGMRRYASVKLKHVYPEGSILLHGSPNSSSPKSSGTVASGDSGGAVFLGDMLVGVISAGDRKQYTHAPRIDVGIAIDFLGPYLE